MKQKCSKIRLFPRKTNLSTTTNPFPKKNKKNIAKIKTKPSITKTSSINIKKKSTNPNNNNPSTPPPRTKRNQPKSTKYSSPFAAFSPTTNHKPSSAFLSHTTTTKCKPSTNSWKFLKMPAKAPSWTSFLRHPPNLRTRWKKRVLQNS